MKFIHKIFRLFFSKPLRKRQHNIHRQIAENNIDNNKKYAVVRDNGNIIVQFYLRNEAKGFSEQLNLSYKENGLRVKSSVVNLIEYTNSQKEFYFVQ